MASRSLRTLSNAIRHPTVGKTTWNQRLFVSATLLLSLITAWHLVPREWKPLSSLPAKSTPSYAQDIHNYFSSFNGHAVCNIQAQELYSPPIHGLSHTSVPNQHCSTRKTLLEAMSNGGRVGFDTPYQPQGCHYRWYSVTEICMILDRFDDVVFIGDFQIQTIYNGLSILLRRDLRSGALKSWELDEAALEECACNNQFVKASCTQHFITSSQQLFDNTPKDLQQEVYKNTPLTFLELISHPAPTEAVEQFRKLVPQVPRSNYKPVPIILSLSPSTVNKDTAASSLLQILKLADEPKRKTPILWVGPTAAGHIDVKHRKGNQEIWDFHKAMAKIAKDNDVEVLGMWNMTVQADSYDGLRFGEKVAITQAMMVVNWLSRLPSS